MQRYGLSVRMRIQFNKRHLLVIVVCLILCFCTCCSYYCLVVYQMSRLQRYMAQGCVLHILLLKKRVYSPKKKIQCGQWGIYDEAYGDRCEWKGTSEFNEICYDSYPYFLCNIFFNSSFRESQGGFLCTAILILVCCFCYK